MSFQSDHLRYQQTTYKITCPIYLTIDVISNIIGIQNSNKATEQNNNFQYLRVINQNIYWEYT